MKLFNLLIICITLTAAMCDGSGDSGKAPTRSSLKIALLDSLSVDDEDNERHLTEDMRTLCDVIVSDSKDCNRVFILDPTISRLDLGKELSLKTVIEKGGSKDVSNPKVIGRLIKKNLEEISVPKEFAKSSTSNQKTQILSDFIGTKASKDSILVFSTDGSFDIYSLKNKAYKVFTSLEDIRNKIQAVLCESPTTNFTLLINPPTITASIKGEGPKMIHSGSETTARVIKKSSTRSYTRRVQSDNGDLTIIKGSEGCDICTRYYSATDNLGRVRQVTQRNSTECCPCGKTIEMRGRTYRMECNEGGSNRLVIAD